MKREAKDGNKKNCVEVRREIIDGAEWIWRIHPSRLMQRQPRNACYYTALYKCERCGLLYETSMRTIPPPETRCRHPANPWCGNPPKIVLFFRNFRVGVAKLIKAEVDAYACEGD
jgi:hypothetical protein